MTKTGASGRDDQIYVVTTGKIPDGVRQICKLVAHDQPLNDFRAIALEQFSKLVQVFGGELGGPMAALAPLVGEMLGVERARIELEDDGLRHSVRIGDAIDFEVQDIVPFGVETGEPVRFSHMFHPVSSDLTMAEAKRSRINAFGIEYEGKTGLSKSEFSWAA